MTCALPSIATDISCRRGAPPTPEVVLVPAGDFVMGTGDDDKFATDVERPAHTVRFEYPFALGKHPITVGEFRHFAPLHASGEDDELPVVNVSWDDATAYCDWLRATTARPFRLPTEAEWEYACRSGSEAPFSTGSHIEPRDANFLYAEDGERIGAGRRLPIGSHTPNAYGLCDLHGNVSEWVDDHWHPNYVGAPTDGSAWLDDTDSTRRVIRGGAWDYLPRLLRSAGRDALPTNARRDNLGFRVALTLHA